MAPIPTATRSKCLLLLLFHTEIVASCYRRIIIIVIDATYGMCRSIILACSHDAHRGQIWGWSLILDSWCCRHHCLVSSASFFVSLAGSFSFCSTQQQKKMKNATTTTAATTTASDTTDDENVRRGGIAVKMALCKSQSVIPSNWSNDMGKSNSSRERIPSIIVLPCKSTTTNIRINTKR